MKLVPTLSWWGWAKLSNLQKTPFPYNPNRRFIRFHFTLTCLLRMGPALQMPIPGSIIGVLLFRPRSPTLLHVYMWPARPCAYPALGRKFTQHSLPRSISITSTGGFIIPISQLRKQACLLQLSQSASRSEIRTQGWLTSGLVPFSVKELGQLDTERKRAWWKLPHISCKSLLSKACGYLDRAHCRKMLVHLLFLSPCHCSEKSKGSLYSTPQTMYFGFGPSGPLDLKILEQWCEWTWKTYEHFCKAWWQDCPELGPEAPVARRRHAFDLRARGGVSVYFL